MPEFTVKEVRLPELHLPEIKRDEIVRSLAGVRLPEVDLAKGRRATIKVPAASVSGSDVGKLIAAAATIARFARPAPRRSARFALSFGRRSRSPLTRIVQPRKRRSRWPLAIGIAIAAGLGVWAILRRPEVRRRVDSMASDARTRLGELRGSAEEHAMEVHEPVAVTVPDAPSAADAAMETAGSVAEETNALA